MREMKVRWVLFLLVSGMFLGTGCAQKPYGETVTGPDPETDPPGSVRVMAYNIHHAGGMDGVVDIERIANVIRESGADIVALQEVDVMVGRSGHIHQVRELARLTGLEHTAFGANIDLDEGWYGTATLSRFPILEEKNTHFEQIGPEQRGVLETLLDVNGEELLFLNTHLDHRGEDDRERILYVNEAREKILPRYSAERVLFAGDFNTRPDSEAYRLVTEYMTDSWVEIGKGEGNTIPSNDPNRRIDYIFYQGDLRPVHAWVPRTTASDHLPVAAIFELH
ncbi:MAG: endonuclease/exonuclease/phosphatase family protein [Balneolaceae bacterium]